MIDTIQFYPGLANNDHVCLMFNLSCYTPVSNDTMQLRYNLCRADFEKLRCLLDAIDWNGELANLDVNQQWSYFSNILTNCLNDSIPLCKPRARKNIYITHEAIRMKNTKNKLWKRYMSSRSPSDWNAFRDARNSLRSYTRKLREDFEDDLTNGIKSNPKRFWQYIKSRLHTRSSIGDICNTNGDPVSDTQGNLIYLMTIFAVFLLMNLPTLLCHTLICLMVYLLYQISTSLLI